MKTPDWRSPEAYAGVAHLPMCDIAWEFLRRNQSYRATFRKSQNEECVRDKSLINYWELGLMADPDLSARDADICWRYERCASVIILSNMLRGSSYPCLNLSDVRGQIIRKSAEDGTHLIVRDKNYCFQLFLLATADLGDALQANIPFDDIAGTRCEAVNRFYRFLIGETPAKMPRRCGMRAKYPHALQADPPPMNWSTLMYVFGQEKEDGYAQEKTDAGRNCRKATTGRYSCFTGEKRG